MWLPLARAASRPYVPGPLVFILLCAVLFAVGWFHMRFEEHEAPAFSDVKKAFSRELDLRLLESNETDTDVIYLELKRMEERINKAMKPRAVHLTRSALKTAHLFLGMDNNAQYDVLSVIWIFFSYFSWGFSIFIIVSRIQRHEMETEREGGFSEFFCGELDNNNTKRETDELLAEEGPECSHAKSTFPCLLHFFLSLMLFVFMTMAVANVYKMSLFEAAAVFWNYANGVEFSLHSNDNFQNFIFFVLALFQSILFRVAVVSATIAFLGFLSVSPSFPCGGAPPQ